MKINKLKFRNIGSYGNKLQELTFKDEGSLNMIVGKNGAGKCVHPETEIEIEFTNKKLEKEYVEYINRI